MNVSDYNTEHTFSETDICTALSKQLVVLLRLANCLIFFFKTVIRVVAFIGELGYVLTFGCISMYLSTNFCILTFKPYLK